MDVSQPRQTALMKMLGSTSMWPPEEEKARAILVKSNLLGVLGTTRRDGSPLLAPMWFRFDGSRVLIWTGDATQRVWVRCIGRDDRVSFSVHDYLSPWPSVVIRGHARVSALTPRQIDEEIRRISLRYISADEIDDYVESNRDLKTIVTIEPTKVSYAPG
jgi:PPOX class probable F420-dependent enzyme